MAQACKVCTHPDRSAIDGDIVERNGSMRGIARKFRVSEDALSRHAKSHLPKVLAVAAASREETRAGTLLDRVHAAEDHARRLAEKAEEDGDIRAAIAGLKVLLEALGLLSKVAAAEEVDLTSHPEWLRLRETIADALGPYPEALEAVRKALRETDFRKPAPIIVELDLGRPFGASLD